jgi:hypothetical protein
MDELDRLAEQAADAWRPVTEAAGFPDHPAADAACMREVVQANLDGLAAGLRASLDAQIRALPWPLRACLRLRTGLRRLRRQVR